MRTYTEKELFHYLCKMAHHVREKGFGHHSITVPFVENWIEDNVTKDLQQAKALIVHNSDEVKACFIGKTDEEIIEKLKKSEHWEDITDTLLQDDEKEEQEGNITMDHITSLYHSGDSEDGYTLMDTI